MIIRISLINEEKLRLEYDIKQRTDTFNKQLAELRRDNENIQVALNEKQTINKKLYNDNNQLYRANEQRNLEISQMREKVEDSQLLNEKLKNEKSQLEKYNQSLNESKAIQKNQLDRLNEDCEKLHKICSEQENRIKNLESERLKLLNKTDENNFEIKNLLGKLKSKEEALVYGQKQNDDLGKANLRLQDALSENELINNKLRNENNNLNNLLNKERNIRKDLEQTNEKLEGTLRDKERDLRQFFTDLENEKSNVERLNIDKNRISNQLDKLKSHLALLTDQNHKLSDLTDEAITQDDRISNQLDRRNYFQSLISNNRGEIEKSLQDLDEFLNRSNIRALNSNTWARNGTKSPSVEKSV